MDIFGEFIGTLILILLGNGVVAGVVLPKTKSHAAGWVVIALGWGIAVAVAAFISGNLGPAHLNPALTLAMAVHGSLAWSLVAPYILAQVAGAMVGSFLVYLQYKPHYDEAKSEGDVLATFATGPAIRNTFSNVFSEIIGTFVLVLAILSFGFYAMPPGLGTFAVGTLIVGIGLSLGGTTGYALNPARDFGPRLLHAILPLKRKGSSEWGYAWIPIVGPVLGGLLAVLVYGFFG